LPRRVHSSFALVFAAGLALGACKNAAGVLEDKSEGGFFSKPMNAFDKPDWARPMTGKVELGGGGSVGPDDLVGADGRCNALAAEAPAQPTAAPSAAPPAPGNAAGDATGAPRSGPPPAGPVAPATAEAGAPSVLGGIALGMTECQTVQRAGLPGNVSIGAGDKGGRRVVLTYLSGPWPGIYQFNDGRLKEIDRAPTPPEPPKAAPKKKATKKKPASAKASQRTIEKVQ
jgi:hypothetical protein